MFTRILQLSLIAAVSSGIYADDTPLEHQDPFYVGAGFGISFLQPEANSIALTLTDDSDLAYKLLFGYEFDQHWAIEAFWSNLGEAVFSSSAGSNFNVEYKVFGVGGLYNHPLAEDWDVFIKLGAGRLENNVSGLNLQRVEDNFIYAGTGITWNMTGSWYLRAEYEYYDTDAQLLSFNVIKRFGSGNSRRINQLENRVNEQDKLLNAASLATPIIALNKETGCENFSIELHGVLFSRGSIELDQASRKSLDSVAEKMISLPSDIRFEIRAHTDNVGTEMYNYALSLSRARNVRDYLSQQGIPLGRIDAKGYGEWRPRDSNETEAGRDRNRRAELVLTGLENHVEDMSTCPDIISEPVLR